ncbi:MAG: 30S ribosomal protein S7 [Chlamydiae bacterium GWC2_50_10]|nr:MAG: 30S ribosomal protein S7 [Chlamydiae bacterium GWA2_50_15]OGN53905.1 MAG: 30S ribosomal protein S7 [Chlamydiae bacterium GWF2_49_8]OGN53943.1 MAG: 30S ribosomal protein S7 [Chlamydiae bacterium GWC2_50_10]OGN58022.1 MAG: 30S ribosomal protein S7 [Chlamydiae bacterium RIFCSPHIGHO2_02_FULL_49_29]OGN63678.1 MAG: 30S ribosomal protein S7 [Chlamydiae bacterium RIFCSPHIGHO2_12_FULL_49_32]OGN71824.1 MAG: 30S ribosomal protein S7 [Chlamydiae bacterium RIFCSPLOWO2_02_FULL_49_12]OGN73592.1 MAG:
MSRRHRAVKRTRQPDPTFKSLVLSKFINCLMIQGKKSIAQKIVYQALEAFAEKVKADNSLQAFEQALENAKPSLEVKSRRIGGATYQVPVEIPSERSAALAMKWIIQHSRQKVGKSMEEGLALELSDCFQNQGATIKKKDDMHRMAESNRAFAHYKW